MTREQLVLQLQQEFAARREDNLRAYEERITAACEVCEGLRALIAARRNALMEGLRGALYPVVKKEDANAALPSTLQQYNEKIAQKLKACGLPQETMAPIYTCPICKDEGYVYEPSRRMCTCLETELRQRMLTELGLQKTQTFEDFKEEVYNEEPVISSLTQRVLMRRNRDVCERFADTYPDTEVRDLLFTGKSGLGKTFLMQAIAHRVTSRGYSVQYISAYKLLDTMRKAYFENNDERLRPYMDAPLLLIDDLGTEPLMENITVIQLFNLLNERQNAGRHTIISTNLNMVELKARYTERITSRLMDDTCCKVLKFAGDDVRTRLGKANGGKA